MCYKPSLQCVSGVRMSLPGGWNWYNSSSVGSKSFCPLGQCWATRSNRLLSTLPMLGQHQPYSWVKVGSQHQANIILSFGPMLQQCQACYKKCSLANLRSTLVQWCQVWKMHPCQSWVNIVPLLGQSMANCVRVLMISVPLSKNGATLGQQCQGCYKKCTLANAGLAGLTLVLLLWKECPYKCWPNVKSSCQY